jgi:hypothetical protein
MQHFFFFVILLSSVSSFVPRTTRIFINRRSVVKSNPAQCDKPVQLHEVTRAHSLVLFPTVSNDQGCELFKKSLLFQVDESEALITLRQPWDGKKIECFAEFTASIKDDPNQYVVAIPADPCVEICEIDAKTSEVGPHFCFAACSCSIIRLLCSSQPLMGMILSWTAVSLLPHVKF